MQPCYSCHGMFEPYLHLPYCVRDFIVFLCHCCRLNCRVACGWQSPRLNPPVLRLCPWLLICLLEWGSLCRSSSLPISFKALLSMQLVTWAPKQYFLLFALLSHNSCADLWSVSWSQNVPCSGLIFFTPLPHSLLPSVPFPLVCCPNLPSTFLLTLALNIYPPPTYFTPLTMLPCIRWLRLVLILLSSIFWSWAENCPVVCLCPDPHTVDCSGRGLTRLPNEIPLDVRRLLLADNWIPRIPSDFLVLYSDLVYLDLRNNSLSHIEPGTLSTSSRLVFLDLGSNNLTEIPKGTFGESRSLIKLRLGNNPYLSMVNEDAFTGLTSLRELELERNALSTLKVGALSQLPSLRVVRLEGNPWICNCNFANLFTWLMENSHKLPNGKYSQTAFPGSQLK